MEWSPAKRHGKGEEGLTEEKLGVFFVHWQCPQCAQNTWPWRAWLVKADEAGNECEIEYMRCPACGEIDLESSPAKEAGNRIKESFREHPLTFDLVFFAAPMGDYIIHEDSKE